MAVCLNSRLYRLVLILVAGLSFSSTNAQTITNLGVTFANGVVTVTYDVQGTYPDQTFSLDLYSSMDNFTAPLKAISGDVGKAVKAGTNKKILWTAATELGNFEGQLTFKVKGTANIIPYSFKEPSVNKTVRMGKTLKIAWRGGYPDDKITIQVFNGDRLVTDLKQTQNAGSTTWTLPKNLEKGTYSIRLTNKTETVQSETFVVKAPVPLMAKLIPVGVVVVGVVIILLPKPNDDLPAAPGPK